MNSVSVFLGGGAGSLLRYLIGYAVLKLNISLPLATLISNLLACLIFAITLNFMGNKDQTTLRLLILTGFCGGLSTFSTFGYESFLLLKSGNYFWMAANMVLSLTLCIGTFILFRK